MQNRITEGMVVEAIVAGRPENILDPIRESIKHKRSLHIDDNALAQLASIVLPESDIDRYLKHHLESKKLPGSKWGVIAYLASRGSRVRRFAKSIASKNAD